MTQEKNNTNSPLRSLLKDIIEYVIPGSICIGYIFFISFSYYISGTRVLMEFISTIDVINVTVCYFFAILVIYFIIPNIMFGPDSDQSSMVYDSYKRIINNDIKSLSEEDIKLIREIINLSIILILIPFLLCAYFALQHFFKFSYINSNYFSPFFTISFLPTIILRWVSIIKKERRKFERKLLLLKSIITTFSLIIFAYGMFCGANILNTKINNIKIILNGGDIVNGVIVYNLSDGVIIKKVDNKNIFYYPKSGIKSIELIK